MIGFGFWLLDDLPCLHNWQHRKSAQCFPFDSTFNKNQTLDQAGFYCPRKPWVSAKGISQAKKHLNDVINDVKGRKVIRALQSAMMLYRHRGGIYTPIDPQL